MVFGIPRGATKKCMNVNIGTFSSSTLKTIQIKLMQLHSRMLQNKLLAYPLYNSMNMAIKERLKRPQTFFQNYSSILTYSNYSSTWRRIYQWETNKKHCNCMWQNGLYKKSRITHANPWNSVWIIKHCLTATIPKKKLFLAHCF